MGTPSKMEAYRQHKDTPVPWNIDQRNEQSKRRNTLVQRVEQGSPAGETRVPDSVREVVSSPGQSLDPSIQRTMEHRMGEDFSDVQVHTGPKAAQAAEEINAKAFTVGNHVAFNRGEYDPGSPGGQHVIAHELAHVRQQTGGAVSMLPQDDVQLEIDPDPELEAEAEETAQRVMQGDKLGIQCMRRTDVYVQQPSLQRTKNGISAKEGLKKTKQIRLSYEEVSDSLFEESARNVAYAVVDMDGEGEYTLEAVSGKESPDGTVPSPDKLETARAFDTEPQGFMPTRNHTEVKILERIKRTYQGTGKTGTVEMFSERKPCVSCDNVIDQFRNVFGADIKLIVTDSGFGATQKITREQMKGVVPDLAEKL